LKVSNEQVVVLSSVGRLFHALGAATERPVAYVTVGAWNEVVSAETS